MTDDYLGVAEKVNMLFVGESREAPALFNYGKKIYMLTSKCTGWRPNQGGYSYSDSLLNSWQKTSDCGDATTYHSQPTSVLTLDINGKEQYVYIGDRWGGNQWDGYNLDDFVYENSLALGSGESVKLNASFFDKDFGLLGVNLFFNGVHWILDLCKYNIFYKSEIFYEKKINQIFSLGIKNSFFLRYGFVNDIANKIYDSKNQTSIYLRINFF
jgi:hypothetical protein